MGQRSPPPVPPPLRPHLPWLRTTALGRLAIARWRRLVGPLTVSGGITLLACSATASTFLGWQVTGVPAWDFLNIRAYPSSGSRILVGYPNGTPLSLTGRCIGLSLNAISGKAHWQQRQAVRSRWCEVVVERPGSGQVRTGWVYGRYIRPL